MRPLVLAFSLLATTAVLAAAAQAQTCGPLKRALSLDLRPGPQGGPLFGVAVTVNGTPRTFLLNTRNSSAVSRQVVTEQKISTRTWGKSYLIDGSSINAYAVTIDLGVGGQVLKDNEMLVNENLGRWDGLFAPDLMQHYDIEMDFVGRKLNYFLTDHCDGQVVYWPNAGITSVDFHGWDDHRDFPDLTIPVSIDGHEVMASVIASNPDTTMDADTAHQLFQLTADSPGAVPLGTLDGNLAHRVYGYTFKTLTIGGLTIRSPRMRVIPDLVGTKGTETVQADSHIVRRTDHTLPAIRLGMNVLGRLHLYLAAKEHKLYITNAPAAAQSAGARTGDAPGARESAAGGQ
jgi:hypothetical protein